MTAKLGTSLEQCGALQDILTISMEYGTTISVYLRTEDSVRRDSYEDYKSGNASPTLEPVSIPAFPVTFQPNSRQLEKAGIREDCELLVYTPMLSWISLGVSFEDIDMIRSTVNFQGVKYVIKEKALAGQFTDTFLQITLGLERK